MTGPEVVVVGAGPVGLLLAGELRLRGIEVLLADRLAAPMTESRASQLNARTVELLDERDLLGRFAGIEHVDRGHYAGLPVEVSGTDSAHDGLWKFPQYETESALREWVAELGVDFRREYELRGLTDAGDHVETEFATPKGTVHVPADYVVGCDGADSAVRRLAGIEFVGADPTRELLRADVTGIDVRDRRFERLEHGLAVAATRAGVTRVMVHQFGGPVPVRDAAPPFDEVVRTWAKLTGEDIGAGTAVWVDSFDNTRKQAAEYRRGRVLLAGDAAHVHMPIGGHALNLGLQDAFNLGWKLAAQIRGWAPENLLDSYHDERHAVGAAVLDDVAAQELLLLGGPEVDAMRAVLSELLELPDARANIVATASGLDVRYGPDGARMPRIELDGGSTTQLLRSGRGLLLDLSGDEGLREAAAGWADRVDLVAARPAEDAAGQAFLVRPDGYVAWRSTSDEPLPVSLRRWFGVPR
ncbi:FAD-dependent monooxygenase [Saccharopolyspora taberi]|uniref:FAD-dependent monooxygenase n=1 Tax=Saccharopolyspora taberi TaxID=60895 RepID=A0ABN3VBP5_9PSEU